MRAGAASLIAILAAGTLAGGLIWACGLRVVTVRGESMAPHLHGGDRVLISRVPLWFRGPRPGDIVLAEVPRINEGGAGSRLRGDLVLKRVARLEGRGEQARVFLLGDNDGASRDSRVYGTIPLSRLQGVMIWAWTQSAEGSRRTDPAGR